MGEKTRGSWSEIAWSGSYFALDQAEFMKVVRVGGLCGEKAMFECDVLMRLFDVKRPRANARNEISFKTTSNS